MTEIYLDNNATTPLDHRVIEAFRDSLENDYGNASSLHAVGTRAESLLQRSREAVAEQLGVTAEWVTFSSGGTEGNNAAIKGLFAANSNRGNHIVTSAIEHPSLLEPLRQLEATGVSVSYVGPEPSGVVDASKLAAAVGDETVLVSVMHVNNESGAIQPLREIAEQVRARNPRTLIHVDGVQAFGKLLFNAGSVDAYTTSAHKLHGPKGVGALLLRPRIRFEPLLSGGGHEGGVRSGTENVPGIHGFAVAARLAYEELSHTEERLSKLKGRLEDAISQIEAAQVLSGRPGVANTVLAAFPPVPGELIVNALSERGIHVSTGAACSSRRRKRSHVLDATGYASEVLESSIRFSMSRFTTSEEIDRSIRALREELPRLRRAALRSAS